ncbi:hypothetical protein ACIQXV_20130 [Neobacillus sp. NPDC097160]|uniref:hypothetical protein n=1 Tax=Neobacillus sp. NPDC097160 TaxID=3364298 RepID=UPI0037F21A67
MAIMTEFRREGEKDPNTFVKYMIEQFPDTFHLLEYDDVVQYDADLENSAILANTNMIKLFIREITGYFFCMNLNTEMNDTK